MILKKDIIVEKINVDENSIVVYGISTNNMVVRGRAHYFDLSRRGDI